MGTTRAIGCAGIGAAALATALAFGSPVAGGKGEPTTACPKDKLCVWTGANYTDDRLLISTRKLSNKITVAPGAFGDAVSSLKLRKPGAAILYAQVDGGSPFRCFRFEDRKVPDLSIPDWQFDNQASSSRIPKNEGNAECSAP